jgi:hypothetical protein
MLVATVSVAVTPSGRGSVKAIVFNASEEFGLVKMNFKVEVAPN